MNFTITWSDFYTATGRDPEHDDLERCNCPDAGKPMHYGCGWCAHGKPMFLCMHCFPLPPNQRPK